MQNKPKRINRNITARRGLVPLIFGFLTALKHLAITFIPASVNTSVSYSILDRTVRFVRMRTIRKCTQMDVGT